MSHNIKTDDDRIIRVTSTHHQMQLPPDNEDADIIAWAETPLSDCYEGAPGVNYEPEVEADCVFYHNTRALAMQYHPEFMDTDSEGFQYAGELVERFHGKPKK
jgi:GMP synthase-like glutamine amidotransferase